uniref:FtsA domain-containing protein n=1 Tax=Rhabditophanes sp. KR3021 TaxID=114890 RepID=A0AC35TV92_9BILA
MNNFINGNVLIIHIGKTMLETSILNLESNDYTFLGNKFDSSVSGTKIDDYLVKYAVDSLKSKKTQLNIPEYYMKDLRIECERVKKMLDIAPYGNVLVEKYRVKISLLVLNNLCKEMYATIIRTIEEVLSEASLTKNEISKIFLIGNSTKASEIKRIVNEYFESKQVIQEIDPDQMAVKGAAIFSSDPFDINEQLIEKSAVNIVNLSVEEIEKAKHTFEIDFFKSEDFKKATDFKRELWYCLENVMDALNNKSTRINFDLYYFPEAYQDIKKTFRWADEKMSTLTYKEVSEKRKGIKKVVFSILEKADTFGSYYFPDLDETLL